MSLLHEFLDDIVIDSLDGMFDPKSDLDEYKEALPSNLASVLMFELTYALQDADGSTQQPQ